MKFELHVSQLGGIQLNTSSFNICELSNHLKHSKIHSQL
jgi:hypothetical protein